MSTPQPPSLRSRRRWHPFWIAFGTLSLVGAMMIAAFYLEENWRGAHEWAVCERELAAKGEILSWHAFVPPPIPDEQNLAMSPLFVRALGYQIDPEIHRYTYGPDNQRSRDTYGMPFDGEKPTDAAQSGWDLARPVGLPAYARFLRGKSGFPHAPQPQSPADDVLLAMSHYAPVLDELAQAAAQRPLSRFPANWEGENPYMTPLPQYNLEMQFVRTLAVRASAQLAAGHHEAALHDLELCWRLDGDMRKDPVLIAHLVHVTCLNMTLTQVWEGLAGHRWSAEELARVQNDLQRFDMLADYVAAFRGERTYDLHGIDFVATHRDLPRLLAIIKGPFGEVPRTNVLERLAYHATPRGWFDLNKATVAWHMQRYHIEAVDPKAHRFLRDRLDAGSNEVNHLSIFNFLSRDSFSLFSGFAARDARLQTGLDEAVTACALERYFQDHQVYPARLDELIPAYLARVPTDVVDGAPLHYRLTPNGRFQLYAVGWDGKDHGGRVEWETNGRPNSKKGDIVWQYAELMRPDKGG